MDKTPKFPISPRPAKHLNSEAPLKITLLGHLNTGKELANHS
jgi:hypothetical protein